MAVRPPQQGSDDVDDIEFGIAVLDAHLDDSIDYPVTADDLVTQLGDPEIPYDAGGNTVALSEALERVPRTHFESQTEVQNHLHPVFEEYREAASSGLLAQLRSFLPF